MFFLYIFGNLKSCQIIMFKDPKQLENLENHFQIYTKIIFEHINNLYST